jgi:hypothetical protein
MLHLLRLVVCVGALSALCLAIVCSSGCGQSGPPRGAIKGRVTIGGQPLANGRILFLPAQGPVVSAVIVNGDYQLSQSEGPIAGVNRVEVDAAMDLGFTIDDEAAFAQRGGRPLPPSPVPPEFNRNSKLSIDIRTGTGNALDVTIPGTMQTAAASRR